MTKPSPLAEPALRTPSMPLLAGVGAALVLSAAVLFLATFDWVLTAAYFAGLVVLLLGALAFERMGRRPETSELAAPDWSVTVAAIEGSANGTGEAIAITDRANRLVCANSAFVAAFGEQEAYVQVHRHSAFIC